MGRNSFHELEKLHVERYRQRAQDGQNKISSSIRIFHFLGDIIDLFIPKVLQVFVSASGGDDIDFPKGPSAPENKRKVFDPKYPDTF
jgi:hypothetical protein